MNASTPSKVITRRDNEWHVLDVGLMEYQLCWDLQKELVSLRKEEQVPDTLILVEHPHVLTIGRHGNQKNVIMKNLPLYSIERGGDVTYHGPGQLVGYFIVKLERQYRTLRELVENIGKLLENTTEAHGIKTEWKTKPAGLWTITSRKKIASVGMATKDWITFHGFALNVTTNLSYFKLINPCGMNADVMTSMEKEGANVNLMQVKKTLLQKFTELF